MPYSPMTEADKEAMLAAIGVESVDELFADIPESIRLNRAAEPAQRDGRGGGAPARRARWPRKTRTSPATPAFWAPARTTT